MRSVLLCAIIVAMLCTQAHARKHGAPRKAKPDMIVLHSTGGPTCDAKTGKPIWVKAGELEENLRNIEAHPVLGIHYMIDRDGATRTSVPEHQIAHHVYKYSERSIAIELINDGDGVDPFPAAQLSALIKLMHDINARNAIARENVKRHSDLDTGRMACDRTQRRKVDPGDALAFESVLQRVYDGK